MEEPGQQKPERPAAGKGEQPGQGDPARDAAVHRAAGGRAHAQDSGSFGVGGAYRQSCQRTKQETHRAAQVGRETLPGGERHHIPAHSVDDAPAADTGAQGHHARAEQHQPARNGEYPLGATSVRQRAAQQEHAQEFLPILRPVEKGHGRRSGDLPPAQQAGAGPQPDQQTMTKPAGPIPQSYGQAQPQQDPAPRRPLYVGPPAGHRQGGPGNSGHQRVALAGGDAEAPGQRGPRHNGAQGRAQSGQSGPAIPAEVCNGV